MQKIILGGAARFFPVRLDLADMWARIFSWIFSRFFLVCGIAALKYSLRWNEFSDPNLDTSPNVSRDQIGRRKASDHFGGRMFFRSFRSERCPARSFHSNPWCQQVFSHIWIKSFSFKSLISAGDYLSQQLFTQVLTRSPHQFCGDPSWPQQNIFLKNLDFEMGSYGSIWAHIKTGRSSKVCKL